jgi:hypothetical protein
MERANFVSQSIHETLRLTLPVGWDFFGLNVARLQKTRQVFLYRSLQCGCHYYFVRRYQFREQVIKTYRRVFDSGLVVDLRLWALFEYSQF